MITLCVIAFLYFLPTIVAANRGHGITGILLLNLFFGWTVIGWFAMLLWAALSTPRCYRLAAPVFYSYGEYPYSWRRY